MPMHAVIMAGGSGTRFWPRSRKARPKQFLSIGTERALLAETVARLSPVIEADQVMVVAGTRHAPLVGEVLPELSAEGLVIEPAARNTAPCVGLAAIHIARKDPNTVMAVLPADHHILDEKGFRRLLLAAEQRAAAGEIVTLGIRPTRPETGYGYIHYDGADAIATDQRVDAYRVHRFVEKPQKAVAERYLAEGHYLWNSGMFFFTAARILDDIRRCLPTLHQALERIGAALDEGPERYNAVLQAEFEAIEGISIDYGVMEHAENVRVIPADIGWNDVGHWAALGDFAPADKRGNIVQGDAVLIEAERNVVQSGAGRLVALVGVEDLVVVDTEDALLVCPRDRAQDVRKVVDRLKADKKEELL
ncbi:MAG: mannose-1-phosphate guanylyltransferase [Bradymonadia bacterium]